MTQITINIEDHSIVPHLKKILSAIDGVTIAKQSRKRKSSIEESLEDIEAGRVNKYKNAEALFEALGI